MLQRRAEERMELHFRMLATEFATRNRRPDYETLQWERGFFAGIKFLLDCPTLEAAELAKALAKAAAREEEVRDRA